MSKSIICKKEGFIVYYKHPSEASCGKCSTIRVTNISFLSNGCIQITYSPKGLKWICVFFQVTLTATSATGNSDYLPWILLISCSSHWLTIWHEVKQACIDSDQKTSWTGNNESAITNKGVFNGLELWNLTQNVNTVKDMVNSLHLILQAAIWWLMVGWVLTIIGTQVAQKTYVAVGTVNPFGQSV